MGHCQSAADMPSVLEEAKPNVEKKAPIKAVSPASQSPLSPHFPHFPQSPQSPLSPQSPTSPLVSPRPISNVPIKPLRVALLWTPEDKDTHASHCAVAVLHSLFPGQKVCDCPYALEAKRQLSAKMTPEPRTWEDVAAAALDMIRTGDSSLNEADRALLNVVGTLALNPEQSVTLGMRVQLMAALSPFLVEAKSDGLQVLHAGNFKTVGGRAALRPLLDSAKSSTKLGNVWVVVLSDRAPLAHSSLARELQLIHKRRLDTRFDIVESVPAATVTAKEIAQLIKEAQ